MTQEDQALDIEQLTDREARLAGLEDGLLQKEQELWRQEAAVAKRLAELDAHSSALAQQAQALHRAAMERGTGPAARLTAISPPDVGFGDGQRSHDTRSQALAQRQIAVGRRKDALLARRDALGKTERRADYLGELYAARARDLARVAQSLGMALAPEIAAAVPDLPPTPESPSEDERREVARVGLRVYVGLESGHNFYTGLSRNISAGGLFIATPDPLDLGKAVELLFQLPDGDVVHTEGRVAWVQNAEGPEGVPGMGVNFTDLPPDDAARIRSFIRVRDPIHHPATP